MIDFKVEVEQEEDGRWHLRQLIRNHGDENSVWDVRDGS